MTVWAHLGRQLRHPRGVAGALVGYLMGVVNRRPNRQAIDALKISAADHILELGFGPGRAIRTMAGKASRGRVCGVDQSDVMVRQAGRANRRAIRDGRVSLRLGCFDNLPFPDASFDKVLAVNVVYFWTDPIAVLHEARRVLRPGGLVAIYATDAATMRNWKFAGADTHILFGRDALETAALRSGFESRDIDITTPRIGRGVQGLVATLAKPS